MTPPLTCSSPSPSPVPLPSSLFFPFHRAQTITHRIYSKLTQRRALIRRVICNVFFEFVFETEAHNGIAEMLEILASIINGFAVPIKDEHKIMLIKALVPLHKAKTIAAYHPQLSYCMALYVAKDHTLTRDVIPGLLRYWPFGSSTKQIMFLNELEDIFEYVQVSEDTGGLCRMGFRKRRCIAAFLVHGGVCMTFIRPSIPPPTRTQEDDVASFRDLIALRLAKCIGGLHFQVSERTLLLWNSERFAALMLGSRSHRPALLRHLFPVLYENQQGHWHETIRTLSGHVLDQYAELDHDLFYKLKEEYDGQVAAAAAAAEAEAGAAAGDGSGASGAAASSTPMSPGGGEKAGGGSGASASARSTTPAPPATPGSGAAGPGFSSLVSPGGGGVAVSTAATPSPGGGATASGSPASLSSSLRAGSPAGAGGGGAHSLDKSPSAIAAHAHKAPAVRASSTFAVSDNADLLPHHRDPGTPKRDGLRHGHGMSMPMPIPSMPGGGGEDAAGED
jgi:hypothetical protein